jgi:hypothetical protein
LFLVVCAVAALSSPVAAQHDHAARTLFTARLRAATVRSAEGVRISDATGTGAFTLAADAKSVTWRLTYQGLASPKVSAIDIHNFGEGEDGSVVATLCGRGGPPCPSGSAGTITGTFAIRMPLVRELANGRLYADIHTSAAPNGETRGQLRTAPWMVRSRQFVAAFAEGSGTATFYLTKFPNGTQLAYDITVTRAAPRISLRRSDSKAAPFAVMGASTQANAEVHSGTFSGVLSDVDPGAPLSATFIEALLSGRFDLGIIAPRRIESRLSAVVTEIE